MDEWVGLAGVMTAAGLGFVAWFMRPRYGRIHDLPSAKMLLSIAAPGFKPIEGLLSRDGQWAIFREAERIAFLRVENGTPKASLAKAQDVNALRVIHGRDGNARLQLSIKGNGLDKVSLVCPTIEQADHWRRAIQHMTQEQRRLPLA